MAEQNQKSSLFLIERRREEKRVLVNAPVELTLDRTDGSKVTERTFIEDVSDLGCRFTTRGPIRQGDTVTLKHVGTPGKVVPDEEPRLYKVMWVAPSGRSFTVGARLIKGDKLMDVEALPEAKVETH